MNLQDTSIGERLDSLFRKSHGRILSMLVQHFGPSMIELAEEALMEAYYRALKTWPYKGQPENEQAWLFQVARRALIDQLRKRQRISRGQLPELSEDSVFPDEAIKDPELKLLFLICHPRLKQKDQLAFMLKTLVGFGDAEIAQALMVKKSAIKKRLLRARSMIADEELSFEWPDPADLPRRRRMVHTALYLLFNEGFYSSHPKFWIRKDLCLEAMRLCKYLADHDLGDFETYALLSLMCYHISRYEARLDADEHIILLEEQDRLKWDPYFIRLGDFYLQKSAQLSQPKSRYQVEAFISATHCHAEKFETTNWKQLKHLYEGLYHLAPSDAVLLNLVVVNLYLGDLTKARQIYDEIQAESFNSNAVPYYLVGIKLYQQLQDDLKVDLMLERAMQSARHRKEEEIIKNLRSSI